MTDKNILITGCSSGIGLHIAETLQQRGYNIFACARKAEDVTTLSQAGLHGVLLDLNDSNSIRKCAEKVLQESKGNLYALINNAAYGQQGAVEDLTRETLRNQFETNLFGLVELSNAILPCMHKQGYGRIIQISSVLGFVATPFSGAYVASKYALEGITDTLRLELKNTNIHVSLIEPGPIRSNFRSNALHKYKQTIDADASRFKHSYKYVAAKYESKEDVMPFTLGPEAVTKKVIRSLESKKPKARYFVTVPTYLLAFLKRVLPNSTLDYILLKGSSLNNNPDS